MKKKQNYAQKTVEVIQLVPHERIQERIAEQVVDILLPQIMEEMLFSSTYASESCGGTDRARFHPPDSGGNFQVACIPPGADSSCSGHPFPSLKVGFTARTQGACSQRLSGESPCAKLQRVSSEDCRTPFRGQAVK